MARKQPTPFRVWFNAQAGADAHALASRLGCTEGSIRHYLAGRAIPKPAMLRKLSELTGLPSDAFLFPFDWKRTAA